MQQSDVKEMALAAHMLKLEKLVKVGYKKSFIQTKKMFICPDVDIGNEALLSNVMLANDSDFIMHFNLYEISIYFLSDRSPVQNQPISARPTT